MKKVLLLTFYILSFISVKAQLDTEHWFAPMLRQSNNENNNLVLYASTNETTPFYVKIETNNQIIDSIKISKGSPNKVAISYDYLFPRGTEENREKVLSLGLHVYADKKFYTNVRITQLNHAEIITSKGRAGLGTHFLASAIPNLPQGDYLNSTIGIIATEDFTTIDAFGKNLILNKGQSFVFENTQFGFNTHIGKDIISNKPISVTNGNFNGQYASTATEDGSDILMDQAVPIERLGKDYILVNGNGNIYSKMESALIIATENDTEIYFNNENTLSVKLNKGEHFLMPTKKYIEQTTGISNVYIKSNKNIYVYQLLSGAGNRASGGMNYVPPLNCFLPKTIDEIGFINENPSSADFPNNATTYSTKLNIITLKNATVKLNGVIINGKFGPYSVTGNNEWDTYVVPNVKGTIVIESTRSVTAGISAGNLNVGYGGYFAGATSLPLITKKGNCFPNITLEVDDIHEDFQWQKKNETSGIFENILNEKKFNFKPTGPGDYRCIISNGICGSAVTPTYTVMICSETSYQTIDVCQEINLKLAFTKIQKDIDPDKIKILQTSKGDLQISEDRLIYKVPKDYTENEIDNFSVYIESNDLHPESEIISFKIILKKLITKSDKLESCFINDIGIFDLTLANISSDEDTEIDYYENRIDAATSNTKNKILNIKTYQSKEKIIFASIKNKINCLKIEEISLSRTFVEIDVEVYKSTASIKIKENPNKYQYSLDKITWQTNNIFTNLTRGLHSVYVKSADNCEPVAKEFLIINLINTITPNGDGYNDVLDYSDLRIKKEVSIQVFDRKGLLVYQSNGKDFVWDGKLNGRPVSTDTYWYIIKWIEPDTNLPVFYNDWILIKNR